jgi:hypothetical protein
MTYGRWLGRAAVVAVTLALLTGCASAPPSPVVSIEPLVGRWSGTVDLGRGLEFFYLTIHPDETIVARWRVNWAYGRITIVNGQATYQMTPPPLEGTVRFYHDGKPTLYLDDLFASFHAVVTPQ